MKRIGIIGSGIWQLEEKLLLTLMELSKEIGIPGGIAYLKTDNGILAEKQHLLFWYLLPHLCLAGAGVIGQNCELEKMPESTYEIYLRPEDNLNAFCHRLKKQKTYAKQLKLIK